MYYAYVYYTGIISAVRWSYGCISWLDIFKDNSNEYRKHRGPPQAIGDVRKNMYLVPSSYGITPFRIHSGYTIQYVNESLSSDYYNFFAIIPIPLRQWTDSMIHWFMSHPWYDLFLVIIIGVVWRYAKLYCAYARLAKYLSISLPDEEVSDKYLEDITRPWRTLVPHGSQTKNLQHGLNARLSDVFILPKFLLGPFSVDPSLTRSSLHKEVPLDKLWKAQTKEHPAVIIQGAPGVGKSLLLRALTLYMADRCTDKWLDRGKQIFNGYFHEKPLKTSNIGLDALKDIETLLFPILISLKEYSLYTSNKDHSILDYIKYLCSRKERIPGLFLFLERNISKGNCLILFDGLDEVSKELRSDIEKDVDTFINDHKTNEHKSNISKFNRFFITTRIAGYNRSAFPHQVYPHYAIAEFAPDDINALLSSYHQPDKVMHILDKDQIDKREVELQNNLKELKEALDAKHNECINDLIKNPQFLAILIDIVIEQRRIDLPRQRIQMYKNIIEQLQNPDRKPMPEPIPKELSTECLGSIAINMQRKNTNKLSRNEVLGILTQVPDKGQTQDTVRKQAEALLDDLYERSGIFVKHTETRFGFLDITFQDYFAALYLSQRKDQRFPTGRIKQLVRDICTTSDDTRWSHTFRFAVAYYSQESEHPWIAANKLIELLFKALPNLDYDKQVTIVLLIAESMLEANPSAIQDAYKSEIIDTLLQLYATPTRDTTKDTSDRIKYIIKLLVNDEEHMGLPTHEKFADRFLTSLGMLQDEHTRETVIRTIFQASNLSAKEVKFIEESVKRTSDQHIRQTCREILKDTPSKI